VIYIDEDIYNIAQIIASIILVTATYLINPGRYQLNVLNFLCFSFLSLIAVRLNSYTKRTSIKRQIDTEDSSKKDGLTGVYNRQTLNNMADEIVRQNFIKQTKLTAAMIDVDDFKKFNDVYGHKIGDEVLKKTVEVFKKEIEEKGGMLFRYGGEEFMAVFSNKEMNEVCAIMEKGQTVLKTVKPGEDIKPVTVSIGIYTATPSLGDRIENFFSQADKLMYKSKTKGKDCYTAKEKKEVKLRKISTGDYD
ncbi:MAG: GGDEF domain-containing protein, partial [Erysipelotrichaceae bacterium]